MGYSSGRDIGMICALSSYGAFRGRMHRGKSGTEVAVAREHAKPTVCAHCARPALFLDWQHGVSGLIGLCRAHKHLFRGGHVDG